MLYVGRLLASRALPAGSAADPFSGGSAADMRSDPPSCALPYDNGRWTAATTVFSRRESVGAPDRGRALASGGYTR
jgi:hypothetical protein